MVQLQRKFTNDPLDFTQRREAYAHAGDASPGFQDLPPGQWRGGQLARYAVRVYIEVRPRSWPPRATATVCCTSRDPLTAAGPRLHADPAAVNVRSHATDASDCLPAFRPCLTL